MGLKNVVDKLFPEGTRRRTFIRFFARGIKAISFTNIRKLFKLIKKYGFKSAFEKMVFLLTGDYRLGNQPSYAVWISLNEPDEEELEAQRKHKFKLSPKISIIVPMYNTPEKYFEELVDSLINQTYSNWELCLADRKSRKK